MKKPSNQSGFALLMTIIVVSIMLAIGLTILDVSIKTLALSTNAVQSEIAFHAANAGMECVRYWRDDDDERVNFITGNDVDITCFGQSPITVTEDGSVSNINGGSGEVYTYQFELTHGTPLRCSQATVVVLNSGDSSNLAGIDDSVATNFFPWNKGVKECPEFGDCTLAYVRGYNTTCANVAPGSGGEFIQRELLLQF